VIIAAPLTGLLTQAAKILCFMMHPQIIAALFFVLLFFNCSACNQQAKPPVEQVVEKAVTQTAIDSNEYLLRIYETDGEAIGYGYVNQKGDTVIATGKYQMCFTDTFRTYAFVANKKSPFLIAIDRQQNVLYQVFNYDNGPDEPVDGLFRIVIEKKIGYADAVTGKIIIQPQFDCAFPFANGVAQVSNNCKTKAHGEYSEWLSDHWFYIDTAGNKVAEPKPAND